MRGESSGQSLYFSELKFPHLQDEDYEYKHRIAMEIDQHNHGETHSIVCGI